MCVAGCAALYLTSRFVCCSPDGSALATGSTDGCIRVWDLVSAAAASGAARKLPKQTSAGAAATTAQQLLPCLLIDAVGGGNDAGAATASNGGQPTASRACAAVLCVAFSLDGTRLAAGLGPGTSGEDGEALLWELDVAAEEKDGGGGDGGNRGGFGDRSGSRARCTCRLRGHVGGVTAAAFSPAATVGNEGLPLLLVTAGADGTARVWDLKPSSGGRQGADAAAVGGRREAAGSLLLSPPSRAEARVLCEAAAVLRGHTGSLGCIAFSASGVRLATGSDDCTARVGERAELGGGGGSRVAGIAADAASAVWRGSDGDDGGAACSEWRCVAVLEGHVEGVTSVAFRWVDGVYCL